MSRGKVKKLKRNRVDPYSEARNKIGEGLLELAQKIDNHMFEEKGNR